MPSTLEFPIVTLPENLPLPLTEIPTDVVVSDLIVLVTWVIFNVPDGITFSSVVILLLIESA